MAKVLVIGCGFVGEQVLRRCLEVGHEAMFGEKYGHYRETELRQRGFRGWNDAGDLSWFDAILLCLPSCTHEDREVITSYMNWSYQRADVVAVESTVPPGFCARQHSVGPFVSAPERLCRSLPEWTVRNTPRVVGGVTPEATEVGVAFYRTICDTVYSAPNSTVAELTKLLENVYRATNIALAHEVKDICGLFDVDYNQVLELAQTKPFGFQGFYAGDSFGQCLPLAVELLRGAQVNDEPTMLDRVAQVIASVHGAKSRVSV